MKSPAALNSRQTRSRLEIKVFAHALSSTNQTHPHSTPLRNSKTIFVCFLTEDKQQGKTLMEKGKDNNVCNETAMYLLHVTYDSIQQGVAAKNITFHRGTKKSRSETFF